MKDLIKFFLEIGKLKTIKRKWSVRGVPVTDSESSADHAFRVAMMAWSFGEHEKLDISKVIKMSLIHDLCNVYLEEFTPYDRVLTGDWVKDKEILSGLPRYSQEEKQQITIEKRDQEAKALDTLLEHAPKHLSKEIKELWLDYEEMRTPEGRFVRQVDRLEPLIQTLEYKKEGKLTTDLNVYWFQVKEWLDKPELIEFIETLDDYFYNTKSGKTQVEKHSASEK